MDTGFRRTPLQTVIQPTSSGPPLTGRRKHRYLVPVPFGDVDAVAVVERVGGASSDSHRGAGGKPYSVLRELAAELA